MKTSLIFIAIACLSASAEAKTCNIAPVKIAVIDTGFGFEDKGHGAKLCNKGHIDFTTDRQFSKNYGTEDAVPLDLNNHGTNVIGLIDEYASKSNIRYCIIVVKYFSDQVGSQTTIASTAAIEYATNIGANFINYSGGGTDMDPDERIAVTSFIDRGGKFIAAAGNEHSNLDLPGNTFYPAMADPRVIIVGNKNDNGVRSNSSNYGNIVKRWEFGQYVTSYRITLSGTSQATAIATGKIVSESGNQCDIGF